MGASGGAESEYVKDRYDRAYEQGYRDGYRVSAFRVPTDDRAVNYEDGYRDGRFAREEEERS